MAKREADFDLYIYDLLKEAGIPADTQGSRIPDLNEALKTASKQQTGRVGFPEYVAVVGDFVLVMEDKADRDKLCMKEEDGSLSLSVQATTEYAVNGALHYAQHILQKTSCRKLFAFGNAGDRKHHVLQPIFVDDSGYRWLPEVETFENFSEDHIEEYYRRVVLKELPPEDVELREILRKARELHEHLRNYGGLGEDEKPLVVSAILLALREKEYGFQLSQLTGDSLEDSTDGAILYQHLERSLKRAKVAPEVKKQRVLNQFTLIKDRPQLNTKRADLKNKTPLKFFAEYVEKNVYQAIVSNSREDYLGRFYGEFVSYSGGDGQSLGVVLTPRHITELFCELVDLKPTDVIFDPCCGTGGFLVSGMQYMLQKAESEAERKQIKQKQIYGMEIRDDMFSIATTNMILRGDGQSNLICDDFLAQDAGDLQLKGGGVTVGFMNPPYSQAKGKGTEKLSELNFVYHLLNSITEGGRAAVIVPISVMAGKTKQDRAIKQDILKKHTLEGVITLNKNTFYRVGTHPCLAVFTAGEPHPADKLVKFINFEDDGFEVKKHLGLVETERAKDRKQYLFDGWFGTNREFPSKFLVETTVKDTEEWLHSFYYYEDEIPSETEIENSIADYLTFEFSLLAHRRGYLLDRKEKKPNQNGRVDDLKEHEWKAFYLSDIFQTIQRGKRLKTADHTAGLTPYVSSSALNNGVDDFVGNTEHVRTFSHCLTLANSGSVGKTFYHGYAFVASDHVTALQSSKLNPYSYRFLAAIVQRMEKKYSFNREINDLRIHQERILLPVDDTGEPDYAFMEEYARGKEQEILQRYRCYKGGSHDGTV